MYSVRHNITMLVTNRGIVIIMANSLSNEEVVYIHTHKKKSFLTPSCQG